MHKEVLLALALFCIPNTLNAGVVSGVVSPTVIYGDDNRLDLYRVTNSLEAKLADSTVALFEASHVRADKKGSTVGLITETFGEKFSLCKEEPFYDQPSGAYCSGSLVGPDLIMTAGHCVTSTQECENTRFIFGFSVKAEGAYPTEVPADEVYQCKRIVKREQVGDGADFALIQLTRKVVDHEPLAINRSGAIRNGTPLVVIGHPSGIPVKISGGANVRDAANNGYFVANLDTYGGNSGSAVFNVETGLVEGILVRGETDFVWAGSCKRSNVCADDACRGEDVTKISELADFIP